MKVCIIEDTDEIIKTTISFLKRYSLECKVDFEITTFKDGISFLNNFSPVYDLILLDIVMPGMDGLKVAEKIRERDHTVQIIFVTNMSQYAVKGYEYNATGYIIKPLIYESFISTIDKAIQKAKFENSYVLLNIPVKEGIARIPVNEIQYADVSGHNVTVHTASKDYIVKCSLSDLAKMTDKYFFIQCNVCYLLNPKYISLTTKDTFYIQNIAFPISRLRKKENMSRLLKYLETY